LLFGKPMARGLSILSKINPEKLLHLYILLQVQKDFSCVFDEMMRLKESGSQEAALAMAVSEGFVTS
jgi:hypothetical protein